MDSAERARQGYEAHRYTATRKVMRVTARRFICIRTGTRVGTSLPLLSVCAMGLYSRWEGCSIFLRNILAVQVGKGPGRARVKEGKPASAHPASPITTTNADGEGKRK